MEREQRKSERDGVREGGGRGGGGEGGGGEGGGREKTQKTTRKFAESPSFILRPQCVWKSQC